MEENQYDIRNKKRLLESSRIISATALFVSVSTLVILIYQTHLSNKMYYLEDKALRASVMPILEVGTSWGGNYFRLQVSNVGVGPAKVKSIYIRYDDAVYEADLPSFIWWIANPGADKDERITNYTYSSISPGIVIPINGANTHISANSEETAVKLKDLVFGTEKSGGINVAITYTSIYEDETWTSYLFGSFPIPPESEITRWQEREEEDKELPAGE